MEKKGNVEMMVRTTANNPINAKLNLVQYKKNGMRDKALAHKSVCENVVAFADANPNVPFYAILAMGVGSGSFKTSEYNKGYKKFDANKTATCIAMANAYNQKMGIKGKPSDVTWRLVNRYYNRVSNNLDDFMKSLDNANTADGNRGHFKELCHNLGIEMK